MDANSLRWCNMQLVNTTYNTTDGLAIQRRTTIESDGDSNSVVSFGARIYLSTLSYLFLHNLTVVGTTNVLPVSWSGYLWLRGNVRFDQLNIESTGSRIQSTITLVHDTTSNVVYASPSSFRNIEIVISGEARVAGDLIMKDIWTATMSATARVVNEYQRVDSTVGHSSWTLSTTPLIIGDAQVLL